MRDIFFLLEWLAPGLYIVMAGIIVLYFVRLMRARSELRATYFELERDLAKRRQANAITAMILALEFCVLLFGLQTRALKIIFLCLPSG